MRELGAWRRIGPGFVLQSALPDAAELLGPLEVRTAPYQSRLGSKIVTGRLMI